eukprot:COSAG01_NODE_806_length_13438_cov_1217.428143_11_plen_118_part_00
MEISLISVGSSQILRFPQPSTEAASRFCSLRDTCVGKTTKSEPQPTPRRVRGGGWGWYALAAGRGDRRDGAVRVRRAGEACSLAHHLGTTDTTHTVQTWIHWACNAIHRDDYWKLSW